MKLQSWSRGVALLFQLGARLGWVVNATPRQLYPGNNPVSIVQLGGTQGPSWRARKISPTRGLDPRTVQLVSSRYIDYTIPDHILLMKINENRDYWRMSDTEAAGTSDHNTKFVIILTALCGLYRQWQLAMRQKRQWVESMTLEPLLYQYWLRPRCDNCIVSSGRLLESALSLLRLTCHIVTPLCTLRVRTENDEESEMYCDSK
jgi:hypothetical protein